MSCTLCTIFPGDCVNGVVRRYLFIRSSYERKKRFYSKGFIDRKKREINRLRLVVTYWNNMSIVCLDGGTVFSLI